MLEIIALIFLCKKNGELAARKGLKPGTWKVFTVLAWLVAEIAGMLVAISALGTGNLIGTMAIGLFCAFGGYLAIKYTLEKKPDHFEDDINKIGVKDLRPPVK